MSAAKCHVLAGATSLRSKANHVEQASRYAAKTDHVAQLNANQRLNNEFDYNEWACAQFTIWLTLLINQIKYKHCRIMCRHRKTIIQTYTRSRLFNLFELYYSFWHYLSDFKFLKVQNT